MKLKIDESRSFSSDSEFAPSDDDIGSICSEIEPMAKRKRRQKVAKMEKFNWEQRDDADDNYFRERIEYED